MKRYELKTTLLNELEENGRQIIEDSIRKYDGRGYDLVICYNEETGKISNEFIEDEYNFYKEYNILLNFGNCSESDFYADYRDIHYTWLENGDTDIEDFEEWFDEEFCFGDYYFIDTYYEIIENKIEELFPEEEMEKEKQEEQQKKVLHSYIVENFIDFIENHGFDFEKDFYTLCDEVVEFLYEEFEELKKNNKTRKMNKIIEYIQNIIKIKDYPLILN